MKTIRLFAALLAGIVLTACNGVDEPDQWQGDFGGIKVTDTRQLEQTAWADQTQTPQQVKFTTDGAWDSSIAETSRAEIPAWITISPDHGDAAGSYSIRITLEKNGTGADRTATITIRCGKSTVEITITQLALKEGEEEEPSERNYYVIRSIVEYDTEGRESERITFEFEPENPSRITALKYWDAGENTPYATHIFEYSGSSRMQYTATYTDKGTYLITVDANGYFAWEGGRIESAKRTDQTGNTIDLNFNYAGDFIDQITFRYPSPEGDGLYNWHTDVYAWEQGNCNLITWNMESPQPYSQQYEFDLDDRATCKINRPYFEVTDGRDIDLALLLTEEPDLLRALGFYGRGNAFLPQTVTTTFGSEITKQDFSYSYNLDIPSKTEGEIMRIVVRKYEGSTLLYTRTYGVIAYAN